MSLTVSTLVKYLKNKLDSDDKLQNIQVRGELSNFHKHSSGHLYFTIKDDKAALNCVMFSSRANSINFNPKNGDQVDIKCSASMFETTGQLQLYVSSMKQAGIGDLYQQYELLKNKLNSEGYFESDHKKPLSTYYPSNVAVLVGDNSAAMSDIKTCFQRRWPLCKVDYYPVLVQGKDAPFDIISKLKEVDNLNYDVIILARGGGSFEDLFCFNDENLVKTIYDLKTFIITGIGHEQDYTLVDFVSDMRAPTPTASVELVTRDIKDVIDEIVAYKASLDTSIYKIINNVSLKVDYYLTKVINYSNQLKIYSKEVDSHLKDIESKIINIINSNKKSILSGIDLLNAYSIDNTLKRGFSLVYKNSKLIKNVKDLKVNQNINIKMYGGNINATVKE